MKRIKLPISLLILFSLIYLGFQIITLSRESQNYKSYYAELNHFQYGMFNVDSWKEKLSVIVRDEIENFSVSKKNQAALQKQIENQLTVLIDKIASRMKKTNNKTTEGWIKQSLIEGFVDFKDIKKGVPEYARAMMNEMNKPENEKQIKGILKEKADDFMKRSFAGTKDTPRQLVIQKLGAANEEDAKAIVNQRIEHNQKLIERYAIVAMIIALILFAMEGFTKGQLNQSQYIILVLSLLVLVAIGVSTPMIDMEAKITRFSFTLLDHPITFENQILYFQSKSIMDVFNIMITHKEFQMKIVGILVVCFSVVFPLFKLMSSLAYYYDYCRARQYKIVRFFVLHSGKWSMADVLVVAIFMSYIGFNGIINSQLELIKKSAGGMDVLTTNGTSLQPGYFIFLTYAILALFLSSFLKSRPCHMETTSENPKLD